MNNLRKIKLDGHVVAINPAFIVSAVPDISVPEEEPRVIVEIVDNANFYYAGTLDEFLADIGRVEYMPAVVGTDAKPYRPEVAAAKGNAGKEGGK